MWHVQIAFWHDYYYSLPSLHLHDISIHNTTCHLNECTYVLPLFTMSAMFMWVMMMLMVMVNEKKDDDGMNEWISWRSWSANDTSTIILVFCSRYQWIVIFLVQYIHHSCIIFSSLNESAYNAYLHHHWSLI